MTSIRARIVDLVLPLLGIKRFFAQPERLRERIASTRKKLAPRPAKKWHRRLDIRESEVQGMALMTMEPHGGAEPGAPHLLYLHGGAYVMEIASVHWDAVAQLCERLGASASVPLYPLAPESTVKSTLPLIEALYAERAAKHGAEKAVVMGDSAGGGMALALVQRIDRGDRPGGLVLFSPWLDATCEGEGQQDIEPTDRMLAISGLRECGRLYAGAQSPSDPEISPLFGALEDLPPTAIFAGTRDLLVSDARRLERQLRARGKKDMLYREYEGMPHVWMLLPIPEGRAALAETANFIDECIRTPKP